MRYDLAPGEQRTFDNGYLVCWTDKLNYKVWHETLFVHRKELT